MGVLLVALMIAATMLFFRIINLRASVVDALKSNIIPLLAMYPFVFIMQFELVNLALLRVLVVTVFVAVSIGYNRFIFNLSTKNSIILLVIQIILITAVGIFFKNLREGKIIY